MEVNIKKILNTKNWVFEPEQKFKCTEICGIETSIINGLNEKNEK